MPRTVSAARICALNAGIQIVWGAVLGVSLQARSIDLAGPVDAIRAFTWVAASGALVATIVQIMAGTLSDRVRRRTGDRLWFYGAGVALAIPALAWFYLAPTFAQFIAAFLLLQFAMNVVGGPYQAVIPDFVALDRRGLASSWMSAYQSAGNAFGLIVAAAVNDLRFVALALAVPFVTAYAVTVTYLRRLAPNPVISRSTRPVTLGSTLGALLLSRGLINVGFFTLLDFLLFFVAQSLHAAASQLTFFTGTLFLTFTLAAVPGAIASARPTDRFDKRLAVTVSVVTIAVALGFLSSAASFPVAYAAAALAGAGWGAFVTADWALASALLPQDEMATAMGIWNVATALPQVVAPIVTAPLVTRLNAGHAGAGPRGAIVLALVEFLAGGAAIWRLPRA